MTQQKRSDRLKLQSVEIHGPRQVLLSDSAELGARDCRDGIDPRQQEIYGGDESLKDVRHAYLDGYMTELQLRAKPPEAVMRCLKFPDGSPGIVISGHDLGPGARIEWVEPERLTAKERHTLQEIAANAAVRCGGRDPRLEELVRRAFAAW